MPSSIATAPSPSQSPVLESLETRCMLAAHVPTITEFSLAPSTQPAKVVIGTDRSLYIYEVGAQQIARIKPSTPGTVDIIDVGVTALPQFGMTVSNGGEVFYSVHHGVGFFNPNTGTTDTLPLGTDVSDIVQGPDGNLWVVEPDANKIARITLGGTKANRGLLDKTTTTITTFDVTLPVSGLAFLTKGPKRDIWFSEDLVGKVGQISFPKKGNPTISEFNVPGGAAAQPVGISTGPDKNVWFAELGSNKIARINEKTKAITEFDVPTASSGAFWMTKGPDKAVWFTERDAGKIGRITPKGQLTEFAVPTGPSAKLTSIVSAGKKTLWFTERNADKFGQLSL